MKLLTIKSHKGCMLPPGPNECYKGVNMTGLTKEADDLFALGWSVSIRGNSVSFISPKDPTGRRRAHASQFDAFDWTFELEEGESIESLNRWDSHPATKEKK